MAHSLDEAVADGTITEKAAFCGLSPQDIDRLAKKYPRAKLLVRLRGNNGDARTKMSALEFSRSQEAKDIIHAEGRLFSWLEVRDVLPIPKS